MANFDYESKLWGAHEVRSTPTHLGALRLRYCLDDLKDVTGKVLEVGCGAGGMAKAIKSYRPALEVYGCDISRKAIRTAERNPQGVTFREGNAYDIPFEDESFSAVVMFDLLEHLERPDRAVTEAARVLRSNGLLHLYVPCEGELFSIHGLLARVGWRAKEKYGGHIQRFLISELKKLMKTSGFEIGNYRWSGHLINQVVDVAYFTGLSIRGRNTPMSVEGYLSNVKPSIVSTAISGLKSAVAICSYFESRLFANLPGSGIHLLSYKK